MQQRLRRDAATVDAHAARRGFGVDQGDLHAQVGGEEGGRVPAWPGAEDGKISGVSGHKDGKQ